MPHTYITSADGTVYEAVSARTALRRKIARRTIAAAFTVITALFLSAAVIGLQRAAITPTYAPDPATIKILREAQQANPNGSCHIEWTEDSSFEVICKG